MKSILVMLAFFISTYASAGTLSCATGMGSYDEVEKFQIINKQYVKVGSVSVLGQCKENEGILSCDFKFQSIRNYTVSVDLDSNQGEIDQVFRQAGQVICKATE